MNKIFIDCNPTISTLSTFYETRIHGYASLLICPIGSVGQLLNLIIFTRKRMASPTNRALAALAATDLLMLIMYIPIIWYMFFQLDFKAHPKNLGIGWIKVLLWHYYFHQVLYTFSIFLSTMLAALRYIAIVHPQKYWFNARYVWRIIGCSIIFSMLTRTSFLWAFYTIADDNTIHERFTNSTLMKNMPVGINAGLTIYALKERDSWCLIASYRMISAIVLQGVPSAFILYVSIRLVWILNRKEHHHYLNLASKMDITKTLVVILIMFLFTGIIPQMSHIVLTLLGAACFRTTTHNTCDPVYPRFGNFLDLLILTTSSFNFAVYYIMYDRFRDTLKSFFVTR